MDVDRPEQRTSSTPRGRPWTSTAPATPGHVAQAHGSGRPARVRTHSTAPRHVQPVDCPTLHTPSIRLDSQPCTHRSRAVPEGSARCTQRTDRASKIRHISARAGAGGSPLPHTPGRGAKSWGDRGSLADLGCLRVSMTRARDDPDRTRAGRENGRSGGVRGGRSLGRNGQVSASPGTHPRAVRAPRAPGLASTGVEGGTGAAGTGPGVGRQACCCSGSAVTALSAQARRVLRPHTHGGIDCSRVWQSRSARSCSVRYVVASPCAHLAVSSTTCSREVGAYLSVDVTP